MTEKAERDELMARIADLAAKAADPEYLARFNPESSRYQTARLNEVRGIPEPSFMHLGVT